MKTFFRVMVVKNAVSHTMEKYSELSIDNVIRMFYCTATYSNATFLIRGTRLLSNNRYLMWEKGEQILPNEAAMETRLTSPLCCFSLA